MNTSREGSFDNQNKEKGAVSHFEQFLSKVEVEEEVNDASVEGLRRENDKLECEVRDQLASFDGSKDKISIEKIIQEEALLSEDTLRKLSGPMGTNDGGWYEDKETKRKFYIKIYRDPDQARTEYIVNAIYKELGLKVPDTQLVTIEGKLVVAMSEVPGARRVNREDLKKSQEVQKGFVADAYLANWDVVGLVFDNIVENPNEQDGFYRIDNGGALRFRAQGGGKSFPEDRIDELKNMCNPDYSAGQVFGSLSSKEMREQAINLVNILSEDFLRKIVTESGISDAEGLVRSLVGRRNVLANL